MSTYVHTAPTAGRRVLTRATREGLRPRDWSREARHLDAVAELAGAPRWVRDDVQKADDPRGAAVGRWSMALWLKGWDEEDRDAVPLQPIPSTPWDLLAFRPLCGIDRKEHGQRECWACSKHCPKPGCEVCGGKGTTRRRAPAPPDDWWPARRLARESCGNALGLFERTDHPTADLVAKGMGCGERSCWRCSRLAQWRAVSRYTPGIAAPLRPGWKREFFTVGSTEIIRSPDDFLAWRRRLAALQRGMVEGRKEFGIRPESWAAGITVVETVPRDGGDALWAHAHLLLVRRGWYPYGWSLDRITRAFDLLGLTERQRWTDRGRPRRSALRRVLGDLPELVLEGNADAREVLHGKRGDARPPRSVEELLGCRGLQRHLGDLVEVGGSTGEVGSHDVLNGVDDVRDGQGVGIIARYLSKVQSYMAKVSHDGTHPFWDSAQAQWILKGVRRCQPWGGFRGLHAGPTRRGWELYPGANDPRRLAAVMPALIEGPMLPDDEAPEDGGPVHLPPGTTRDEPASRWELHTLSSERISSWKWCHKPKFWRWIKGKRRAYVRRVRPPWRLFGIPHGFVAPEPVDDERAVGGMSDELVEVTTPQAPTRRTRQPTAQLTWIGEPANATGLRNGRKGSTLGRNRTADQPIRNRMGRPEPGDGPPQRGPPDD